jgi:ABC-type multidrug transport system fused ATPase/permease subunit
VSRFFQPIRDLSQKVAVLQSGLASSERVFDLLDETEQVPQSATPRLPELGPSGGSIQFEGVRFSYVADEPVLRGLNLTIRPGEKLALLGVTGAGKSTALRLINRRYDVDSGSLCVDGINVLDWPVDALRRRVGVVLQDVFLFCGSVRENVALGDTEISDEALWAALHQVGVDKVVERLGGLDATIGERGIRLSAGERQLLAFARVLVYDPAILLLDEATSNVDTFAEERIQRAIETTMEGRTTVVVAHRLSTIQQVDRVAVLRDGELAELGTHRELLEQGGIYKKLYDTYFAMGV